MILHFFLLDAVFLDERWHFLGNFILAFILLVKMVLVVLTQKKHHFKNSVFELKLDFQACEYNSATWACLKSLLFLFKSLLFSLADAVDRCGEKLCLSEFWP